MQAAALCRSIVSIVHKLFIARTHEDAQTNQLMDGWKAR
jgi:hypothetical protein